MATNPISPTYLSDLESETVEPRLTAKEGWELIFSLIGSSKGMYESYGGVDAYIRQTRALDGDSPEA